MTNLLEFLMTEQGEHPVAQLWSDIQVLKLGGAAIGDMPTTGDELQRQITALETAGRVTVERDSQGQATSVAYKPVGPGEKQAELF